MSNGNDRTPVFQNEDWWACFLGWFILLLAVIGVLNAIIGLYYYLSVLKVVYLYRSEDDDQKLPISRSYTLALVVLVFGIILVGTVLAPWFSITNTTLSEFYSPH